MKPRNFILLFALYFLLIAYPDSPAVENVARVSVSVDKSPVYIGDRIRYTISVSAPKEIELKFPEIESRIGEFTVRESGVSKPEKTSGAIEYSKWHILTTYKTGRQMIPQQIVRYKFEGKGEWTSVKTDFVKVEVKSLLAEDPKAKDIRDIKGILGVRSDVAIKILIALSGLAAVLLAVYIFAKKILSRGRRLAPKTADAIAYEELERIKMSALLAEGKAKEYYYRLSSCLRRYLENRFSLRAPEMTLEEFLLAVRDSAVLDESRKNLLKDFLENSDMVKFAKYSATRKEAESAFDFVKRFIDETKL